MRKARDDDGDLEVTATLLPPQRWDYRRDHHTQLARDAYLESSVPFPLFCTDPFVLLLFTMIQIRPSSKAEQILVHGS